MFTRLAIWFKTRSLPGRLWQEYRSYSQLCIQSGYIPKVREWLLLPSRLLLLIWRYIQVGPVKIVGKENLLIKERVIFCPNHGSLFDAIVMHPVFNGIIRYMGAYEPISGFFGLKQIFLTSIGVFPVDRQNGKTVLAPATALLVSGQRLAIFPEGKIYNSGRFGKFKLGPAVIARAAYEELAGKHKVAIVPIHICYGKRDIKSGETFNFWKMGLKWRGGVTVYVAPPIWIHEHLELSAPELMQLVKESMAGFTCPTSGR